MSTDGDGDGPEGGAHVGTNADETSRRPTATISPAGQRIGPIRTALRCRVGARVLVRPFGAPEAGTHQQPPSSSIVGFTVSAKLAPRNKRSILECHKNITVFLFQHKMGSIEMHITPRFSTIRNHHVHHVSNLLSCCILS